MKKEQLLDMIGEAPERDVLDAGQYKRRRLPRMAKWLGGIAAALACLMFNLFSPPCFAALGAMNSELGDKKWFWGGVGLQLATGFTVGFLVYQVGTLVTTGGFGKGFVPGLLAVAVFALIVDRLCVRNGKTATAKK